MNVLTCLRLGDVPLDRLRVCRAFPLASIVVTAAPAVALSVWVCWMYPHHLAAGLRVALEAVWRGHWYLLTVGGLFWATAANDVRKALRATAWLTAFGPEGLFVKWRSYQNSHWGTDDVQVVRVPIEAIRSARVLNRWWVTPDGRYGGGRSEPARYVELRLAPHVDLTVLARHLTDERAGRPNGRSIGWKGMWGDVPVSVEDGSVLRIRWRAWPTAAGFVAELGARGVTIAASSTDELDLHGPPSDAALRELARTGDVFGLVRTLRAHDRGLSLADAKARATALIASSRT